jgi:integrase
VGERGRPAPVHSGPRRGLLQLPDPAPLRRDALAAIRQPDVQAWVAELSSRGFKPATVVKAYQLLGRTMTAAVNADMLPRSPCRAVRLPKVEREEMRFLNPAEVAALADVIGSRYRALVLLGAYGGLRIGELAGLRRRRVDLLRGTVDVAEIVVEVRGELYMGPPKTRAGRRIVTLPRSVVEELAEHLGRSARPTAGCSPPTRAGCCGRPTSESRCGCRRCGQRGWRRCALMTCGTRRWPCGSRRASTPSQVRAVREGPLVPAIVDRPSPGAPNTILQEDQSPPGRSPGGLVGATTGAPAAARSRPGRPSAPA